MALQMPVYREISQIEALVLLGLSWRQLAATVPMVVINGGLCALFFAVNGALDITTWQMFVLFVVALPFALFGWWRPHGMMPERFIGYVWRHYWGKNLYFLDGEARSVRVSAKPTVKEAR
ncbi:hypothetical protein GCM10007377_12290 [Galliscardovia ingluviei]|uniref:PrgI family protein n=1 Tax=Galliscardovia ingluviei TaxID=1769422 RepID=A0A8J3AHS5_9BIFI|nr:PrgI family protein [Galliscardovia ingluviei]GGI14712.1 hypothetical protein GCM10007377_12290 [Galliscardovia ingluviei]